MSGKDIQATYDDKVIQANFSAMLYLLTEQQAMLGKLLQALLDVGALRSHQLDKITDTAEGENGLVPTYNQLYDRFAEYYVRTKAFLDNAENTRKDLPNE